MIRKLCRRKSIVVFLTILLIVSLFPFDQIRADELFDSETQNERMAEEEDNDNSDDVLDSSGSQDDSGSPDNDNDKEDSPEDENNPVDGNHPDGENNPDNGNHPDNENDPEDGERPDGEDNPDEGEPKNCEQTPGCTLQESHEGDCVLKAVDPSEEDGENREEEQPGEEKPESCDKNESCMLEKGHEGECRLRCTKTEGCTLPDGHEGECQLRCTRTEGCTLPDGHEGECIIEEVPADLPAEEQEEGTISVTPYEDSKISAYFGEELKARVSVSVPQKGKNAFFLKMDTDRAGLVSTEGTDSLNWIEEEGGYSFTVENEEAEAQAEFVLIFRSDDNVTEENSNPAKVFIYAGNGADTEEAEEQAEKACQEMNEELELTWSASSDKLQYEISLYWKTADESQKYEQSIDTVKPTTIDLVYVLNIITSSGEYEPGEMEVRIPYALWNYRDGKSACIPSQISIPRKPAVPEDGDIRYHYYVDDKGTSDKSDDELVITNWCKVSAGTDTTIEVKYTVDPCKTIDMSKAELTAKGTATTTLQENAEVHESNTITFQLDTGFEGIRWLIGNDLNPTQTSRYSYADEIKVDGEKIQLDTEKYHYVWYDVQYSVHDRNQEANATWTFCDGLCNEAEMICWYYQSNNYKSCTNKNQWSEKMCTGVGYSGQRTFLVRYPADTRNFKPTIGVEIVADDPDSHSEEDGDHNDLFSGTNTLKAPPVWKDYEYNPGRLESYGKFYAEEADYRFNDVAGGIELLESGESVEMGWRLQQSYNGNLLKEGTKQKFEVYDDGHFWDMGENGTWIPMTEEDYEITDIRKFTIEYSKTNTKNGKVTFPDYEGGTVVFEGYRAGSWEQVGTAEILKAVGRKSQGLSVKMNMDSMEGNGYTRIRALTPGFEVGYILVEFEVYSRIKAESPLVKDDILKEDKERINIENYAAFKHFITDEDGNNYEWSNGYDEQKISSKKEIDTYLKNRDKEEKNYGEKNSEKYMYRCNRSGSLSGLGPRYSDIEKKTVNTTNNVNKQRVEVTFLVREKENLKSENNIDIGKLPGYVSEFEQTQGVFYDLLPEGYHYNTESVPEAYGIYSVTGNKRGRVATIEDVVVMDNWDGTGREMVIFKVNKGVIKENYIFSQYSFGEGIIYHRPSSCTGFEIIFDTYITWKDLVYTTGKSVNLAAFQRGDGKTISGNSRPDNGIPDTMSNSQLYREFGYVTGRDGNSAFYDIDGDGVITDNSTLYAYSEVSINAATAIEVGIDKRVKGNGGIYTLEDTTNLSDTYQYRVGVTNSASGTLKDLIIYDILEEAANKEGATGETTWKGTYQGIDLSRAEKLGINPVVYYSTVQGLDYNEKTGGGKDDWLEDADVWSTTMPEDKTRITAVAVDLRKKTDGSDFELPNSGCVFFEIKMTAPDTLPQLENPQKIYAINRPAYSCYRQTRTSAAGEYATVIGTRVKIRIEETSRTVQKKWEDEENLDKSRPEQIQVQLFADGKPYGDAVILDEKCSWQHTWEHLPKIEIGGSEITWTVEETEVPEGYRVEVKEEGESFIITNSHTPKPAPTPTASPTPEPTPGNGTPAPESTPEPTPGNGTPVPETTPEPPPGNGTPVPETTPEPTPGNGTPAPESTPEPTPGNGTPVPETTPAPTPDFWEETTPEPVKEINPENGINVPETGIHAAVLGVRRTTNCAVLGKRRRPETGDSLKLYFWLAVLLMGTTASAGMGLYLYREKKKGNKENE